MDQLTVNGRTVQLARFRHRELAFQSAERRPGPYANWVVMGDYPEYWVVSPADAQRLERAGYELLSRSARGA